MVHTFNPITQEAEAGGSLEFKASLVYRASSWTARATQRNPSQKTNKQKLATRRADPCVFAASLLCIARFRIARAI